MIYHIFVFFTKIPRVLLYFVSLFPPKKTTSTSEDVNETGYLIVGAQGRTASWWQWQVFFVGSAEVFLQRNPGGLGKIILHPEKI